LHGRRTYVKVLNKRNGKAKAKDAPEEEGQGGKIVPEEDS
jgi:hypothetical protein